MKNKATEADTNTLQSITTAVRAIEGKDTAKERIRPMAELRKQLIYLSK